MYENYKKGTESLKPVYQRNQTKKLKKKQKPNELSSVMFIKNPWDQFEKVKEDRSTDYGGTMVGGIYRKGKFWVSTCSFICNY